MSKHVSNILSAASCKTRPLRALGPKIQLSAPFPCEPQKVYLAIQHWKINEQTIGSQIHQL